MKSLNKTDYLMFAAVIVATVFIVLGQNGCFENSSSRSSSSQSQKEEPFWEGVVKPGTYNISWRETSAYGENANKVSLEISIFDNREFEIREKTECGLECVYRSDVRLFEGIIVRKSEMYNGIEKVWYNFPNESRGYSLTPSGDLYSCQIVHWEYTSWDRPVGKIH